MENLSEEICPICKRTDAAGIRKHLWRVHGIHYSEQNMLDIKAKEKKKSSAKKKKSKADDEKIHSEKTLEKAKSKKAKAIKETD